MSIPWILLSIFLSAIFGGISTQDPPPKIDGSYKATGEMVETVQDDESSFQIQIAFEETYDSKTQDAVFKIWELGVGITFTENYRTGQTFKQTEEGVCQEMTTEEWVETESPPQLLKYEDTNGTVRFSLKQLFSLKDRYLKEKAIPTTFRGLPAKKWAYEINGNEPNSKESRLITVYAYWSDDSWNTTSDQKSSPLGYVVSKMEYERGKPGMKVQEQYINVFGFVPNAVDRQLLEPVQGLVCPNKKQTLKFPDVTNIKALAFHSEILFPDYQQIKYVDTWFDPQNKLIRVDMERIKDEAPILYDKSRKYQSEIILARLGIVYRLAYHKGALQCSIIPIKDFDLDMQNLINFKTDYNYWSIAKMFGLNQTSYVYIGKTTKRDIPCHLFQGKRTDWPEPSANVESLWEWCFSMTNETKGNSVIFRNGEYGLISAQVKILSTSRPADYPANFKIIHNFYDVNSVDPKIMDATNFDIARCFQESEKRRLQFSIDWAVTDENYEMIENLTSDVNFLLNWKTALYRYSGIDPNSLRITTVKAMVTNKVLFVKFTILAKHKDLPKDLSEREISGFDAENKLRDNINKEIVYVSHTLKTGKMIPLRAIGHSLKFQVNNTFIPHVLPTTTPSPVSTTTTFTLFTDDGGKTSPTSGTTTNDKRSTIRGSSTTSGTTVTSFTKLPTTSPTTHPIKDKKTLHQPGAVAGVAIAMILVGISIGSTGWFIRSNGLPDCLSCNARR